MLSCRGPGTAYAPPGAAATDVNQDRGYASYRGVQGLGSTYQQGTVTYPVPSPRSISPPSNVWLVLLNLQTPTVSQDAIVEYTLAHLLVLQVHPATEFMPSVQDILTNFFKVNLGPTVFICM